MLRDIPHPYVFVVGSILAKRCTCTHGRILRYTKYGLCTRQIKMISQWKPRRKLHKSNSDCHEGAAQRLSLRPLVSVHTSYCTLFFLLINTSVASLLSVFVEILFRKAKGPGPFVTDHWSSGYHLLPSPSWPSPISGWERSQLQVITGQGHPRSYLGIYYTVTSF